MRPFQKSICLYRAGEAILEAQGHCHDADGELPELEAACRELFDRIQAEKERQDALVEQWKRENPHPMFDAPKEEL